MQFPIQNASCVHSGRLLLFHKVYNVLEKVNDLQFIEHLVLNDTIMQQRFHPFCGRYYLIPTVHESVTYGVDNVNNNHADNLYIFFKRIDNETNMPNTKEPNPVFRHLFTFLFTANFNRS